MKKLLFIIVTLLFGFVIILVLKPLATSKETSVEISGIVKSISKGGVNDLVFELENDKMTYYINRGLENGFELKKSTSAYLGKNAVLNYAKGWTLLAPFGKTSESITQISIDGKEIYSQWK